MLAQIAYPLTAGTARDHVTLAVVVLFGLACITHAAVVFGGRWAAGFFVITAGLGYAVEILGIATGFPFGSYDYADGRIGPSVAGVPLVIALAWTAGLYPVWTVAHLLCGRYVTRLLATAVGVVGWDLYLDPQMVADGQWTWRSSLSGLPGLPEIPITNYLGWFVVASVMAVAVSALRTTAVDRTTSTVPIVLFLWTWLGSALAHAVFLDAPQLHYSAIYGFLGMGILGIPLVVGVLVRTGGGQLR
ncbi:carotenoid biosynthesis protein [Antrihabitans cavernicola]|uniref:Carotenoid biosynthesis protein n=1 Tax=Antrihabitans cavernicola TaxID=2495913 RepID=A0A5A7SAM1_9NOCA|nr:carotenoid biosynthesis protein [Spelaeibacter cavernicola]